MKENLKWPRYVYSIGVTATIIGAIDPLEGSILIAAGSVLLVVSTFFTRDRHYKIFLTSAILILTGVYTLWFVSSLRRVFFEPYNRWDLLVIPYPTGWLINIIAIIVRAVKKIKPQRIR